MKQFDLDNDPKIDSGFKIPEHYFEQFEAKIMNQLPVKEVKVVSLWQRKSVWISSAAAVLIITLGTWMYFAQKTIENATTTQEYLAYESDITTEDIAMNLTDDDITSIEKELNLYGPESKTYIEENLD